MLSPPTHPHMFETQRLAHILKPFNCSDSRISETTSPVYVGTVISSTIHSCEHRVLANAIFQDIKTGVQSRSSSRCVTSHFTTLLRIKLQVRLSQKLDGNLTDF